MIAELFCYFSTKYSVCSLLWSAAGTFEAVRCRVQMTQCGFLEGTGTEKNNGTVVLSRYFCVGVEMIHDHLIT